MRVSTSAALIGWGCPRIQLLLYFDDFQTASVEVSRRTGWQTDPEALQELANLLLRFASRSTDPSSMYERARVICQHTTTLTGDVTSQAVAIAMMGTAYLEEGRYTEAGTEYARSLVREPANPHALLGRVAIACASQDSDALRRSCQALATRLPTWHEDRELVARLATAPDYAFLRGSSEIFIECFRGRPADLRALHCVQRVAALKEHLGSQAWRSGPTHAHRSRSGRRAGHPAQSWRTRPGRPVLVVEAVEAELVRLYGEASRALEARNPPRPGDAHADRLRRERIRERRRKLVQEELEAIELGYISLGVGPAEPNDFLQV